jgi:hypothetical protein
LPARRSAGPPAIALTSGAPHATTMSLTSSAGFGERISIRWRTLPRSVPLAFARLELRTESPTR